MAAVDRRTATTILASAVLAGASPARADGATPVVELRQYKIAPGKREEMIALFERHFIESQEADDARLIGQFRDLGDPTRFTWIRAFADMQARERMLNDFYFGPVWKAHRGQANPLLEDNDNVLLLHAVSPDLGFAPNRPRPLQGAPEQPGLVVAMIYYLWKAPEDGFAAEFAARAKPVLEAAGLPVLAAFVPEKAPNTFPQLPVRQGEKVFVWFSRFPDETAYRAAQSRLEASPQWRDLDLTDRMERWPQVLRLGPTPRSALS